MPRSSSSSTTSSVAPLVRKALLVETLGTSFVQGQQCLGGPRRDTALFKEEQLRRLSAARSLLSSSPRAVRPSLLTPPASAAAFALGAVAALAASALNAATGGGAGGGAFVSRARGAVSRALEGAASDSYNDSLSALYQAKSKAAGAGTAADNEQLRAVLRELRDAKRAPDYGGGFAASSPSSSASSCEEGDAGGDNSEANASFSSSLERNVDAAVSAAEAAIRAAAGLVFRAGEKL